MALGDDVARLVRECWRLNMAQGFGRRMGWESGIGRLAKAAGATEEQVQAWMSGLAQPTTAQALAVMDALPLPRFGGETEWSWEPEQPAAAAGANGKGH